MKCKIIYIPKENILQILHFKFDYFTIDMNMITNVPAGTLVKSVEFAFNRQCFALIIEHHSFEDLSPGTLIPEFVGEYQRMTYKIEGVTKRKWYLNWMDNCKYMWDVYLAPNNWNYNIDLLFGWCANHPILWPMLFGLILVYTYHKIFYGAF